MKPANEIILKKHQKLDGLNLSSEELYSVRLSRHQTPRWPLIIGRELEKKLTEFKYYNGRGAVESIIIEGPFEFLNLIPK